MPLMPRSTVSLAPMRRGPVGSALVTLLVALLLATTGCAALRIPGDGAVPAHVVTGPAGDAFYVAPPPSATTRPGEVIWARTIHAPGGSVGYALLYWSTTVTGELVAVSGVLFHPVADRPTWSRRILAWAHGTVGLGDTCAPSAGYFRDRGESLNVVRLAIAEDMIFVASDYEGLGPPEPHPYMVSRAAGRNVLDSIRAAIQLTGVALDADAVVLGTSQGGSAALFAAELHPTYAPDVRLRGSIGVSAPSLMNKLDGQLSGGDYFGYVLMTVLGYEAAYPHLTGKHEGLSPAGRDAVARIPTECTGTILDDYGGQTVNQHGVEPVLHSPEFSRAMADNDPGQLRTAVPIFLVHGENDDTIPVENTRDLVRRYCRTGDLVTAKFYPGRGHVDVLFAAVNDIMAFITDRLGDVAMIRTCEAGT
jgi:pimeloyl-ACP methyl ester carboxylesterase